jgi:peptidoglycan/xylan/chitin deacetylase (PgdA/CDA1 family)
VRGIKGLLACVLLLSAVWPAGAAAAEEGSFAFSGSDEAVFGQLAAGHRQPAQREYRKPERPTVYLTFDDGPSANTPKVLDILKQEKVPATFFVLGEQVEARPELARRIVREGHAIGNHSYDHVYGQLYGSFQQYWKQIQRTESILIDTVGEPTRLLRAPGGTSTNFDASYFYYLEQAGYTVFDWNVDSGDSRRAGVPAKEIVYNATKEALRDEMIVLMHDGAGHAETVKALPDIIRFYREKGYAFAALTPDVKPIQFAVGKPKWQRGALAFADFVRWTAVAREHAAVLDDRLPRAPAAGNGEAERREESVSPESKGRVELASAPAQTEAPQPQPTPPEPPLAIHLGERTLSLSASAYMLRDGRLRVPLRDVVESMGGAVEWKPETRQAEVRYGMYRAVYDLVHRRIEVSAPGKPERTIAFADIRLDDNKLVVPLRLAVELIGGKVLDYDFGSDSRMVAVAVSDGFGLPLAPQSPFRDWSSATLLATVRSLPK